MTIEQQLANVMAAHQKWIDTDGKLGLRLDLSGENLWGANLRDAQMYSVDLRGADMYCSRMGNVNLRGADMRNVTLIDADLTGVYFTDGVDLTEAHFVPGGYDPA